MSYKSFAFIILLAVFGMSIGCKTNLLGGEPPAVQQQAPPPQPISVEGVRTSYADVVEHSSPAVVRIESDIKTKGQMMQFPFGDDDFFRGMPGQQQPQQRPQLQRGIGSGVIVSADGTIITNNHVVEGADKITVQTNDDKTFEAKIVGTDKPSDLAVLKIEGQNLPFLTLGNSDNVRVGDIVLAIGNPLGIGQTVTAGIISAKGRRTGLSDGSYEDFLQTDAPINRGNSGGALINLNGELIGINSQILSPGGANGGNIGIGFAIPSDMAMNLAEQLIKYGEVKRGQLGIKGTEMTADIAKAFNVDAQRGAFVSEVLPQSAAQKAGIKSGDIIVSVNDKPITSFAELRVKIGTTAPGEKVKLGLLREGKPVSVDVTLEQSAQTTASAQLLSPALQGATLSDGQTKTGDKGVKIDAIEKGTPAEQVGLQKDDVIIGVNRTRIQNIAEMRKVLEAKPPVMALNVVRGEESIYLLLR